MFKECFIMTALWNTIYNVNDFFYPEKVSRNINSSIHCVTVSILSGIYLLYESLNTYYIIQLFSSSYFLSDIIVIVKTTRYKFHLIRDMYLHHHIACIYGLFYISPSISIPLLFTLELSNVPNSYVYHLIKTNADKKKIQYGKKIQIIMYPFLRLFLAGLIIYYKQSEINTFTIRLLTGFIYLLGIGWSSKLLLKS
jgi:hypothetical protein